MIRTVRHILCLVVLAMVAAAPALAEKRVALVIGNAGYENATTLRNPANDANDIAERLRSLDFEVILGVDQTEADFVDRLSEFALAADRADVALFYYAGHGLQFQGTNYLVPVEAAIESRFQVQQQTVTLDTVIRLMEEKASKVMVFLDACRDNPFADRLQEALSRSGSAAALGRGLARVETRAPETLVTFAAAPGSVAADGQGRNSPFTAALLEHISTPGAEVEVMLKRVTASVLAATGNKQRPERLSRLTSEFYFARADDSIAPPPTTGPTPDAGGDLQMARDIWNEIKGSESEAVLRSFIDTFPGTVFAALANEKLSTLSAPALPATCREVRDQAPTAAYDGEVTLYVRGQANMPYQAFCMDMAGEPTAYLFLGVANGANQSEVVDGGAYEGDGGKDMVTRFSHVRFDPEALAIIPNDLTYASISGAIYQTCCENGGVPAGTRKEIAPAPLGTARNCNAHESNPRIAQSHIDLSRTAFQLAIDMDWKPGGYYPRPTAAATWEIAPDRRTATVTARTGYCAVVSPAGGKIRLTYAGSAVANR